MKGMKGARISAKAASAIMLAAGLSLVVAGAGAIISDYLSMHNVAKYGVGQEIVASDMSLDYPDWVEGDAIVGTPYEFGLSLDPRESHSAVVVVFEMTKASGAINLTDAELMVWDGATFDMLIPRVSGASIVWTHDVVGLTPGTPVTLPLAVAYNVEGDYTTTIHVETV